MPYDIKIHSNVDSLLKNLHRPMEDLKGVGPERKRLFEKLCGEKIIELLLTIPRTYKKRVYLEKISEIYVKKEVAIKVLVVKHLPQYNPKMPYKILCKCDDKELELIFFRGYKKYLKNLLQEGHNKIICGKLEKFSNKYQIIHPEVASIQDLPFVHGQLGIYSLTKGLTIYVYRKIIKQALEYLSEIPEWIEKDIIKENNWESWKKSVLYIHAPKNIEEKKIIKMRDRLAFDEALSHQIKLLILKEKIKKNKCNKIEIDQDIKKEVISKLSFQLTESQKKVLKEIEIDLQKNHPMQRLLQGDVGSGKTIVALISILNVAKKRFQTSLMVPTEILAIQHFNYFKSLLKDSSIKVALLTAKIKKKEKENILKKIEEGKIQIIIGTHAIFQENIKYRNLAYVIIDEQHRFGVHQKFQLTSKGNNPHILAMTATPIPRTLALTMYGNMSISKITELPRNRKKIKTISISKTKVSKIILELKNVIKNNSNAFWICPLIEESENLDLIAAEKRFSLLQKTFKEKVGIIHGKMDTAKKDDVINKFKKKEIQILVSTTIIEVGIDIPTATLIIIEESDRFGLSQLHQLRGRVGRSNIPSTCVLIYNDKKINEIGKKRIQIIKKNDDGFFIAEEDLKLRGFGEMLGTRQTGYQLFKILDPFSDSKLMEIASQEASKVIKYKNEITKEKKIIINNFLKIYNQNSSLKYISIA